MAPEPFRQEMPPKGGYASIIYERIPLKKPWSGYKWFSIWFITTAAAWLALGRSQIRERNRRRAEDEITVALEPLLVAERDRMYLNQLRKNRDEEKELMKNVPNWEVGTLFGEPVYKTIKEGRFMHPVEREYYAHTHPFHYYHNRFYDCKF